MGYMYRLHVGSAAKEKSYVKTQQVSMLSFYIINPPLEVWLYLLCEQNLRPGFAL